MTKTTLPVDTERLSRLGRIQQRASIITAHLNHMHLTEPPAWMYLTDDELDAIEGTLILVSAALKGMRQRANVDDGPFSGRGNDAECLTE